MAYATVQDVEDRYLGQLTTDEQALAEVLLGDAENLIRSRVRDLDTRVTDPNYLAAVVQVESNAVLRVVRNPDGYRQEMDGNYSYSISAAVASGFLSILDNEWALLGVRPGAFTITPVLRPACLPVRVRRPW
ncbi:Gp19/Gp15/Gp42 family protein [Kitasatospora indigofera]|uniref:Gp19/Gp15/Gp42 family protein n=1 Tax=Kitasatospora indigofera TaxID=67307 RepID=UPI00368623E8